MLDKNYLEPNVMYLLLETYLGLLQRLGASDLADKLKRKTHHEQIIKMLVGISLSTI